MAVQSNSSGDFSSLLAAMGHMRERTGPRPHDRFHSFTKNPIFFFFFSRLAAQTTSSHALCERAAQRGELICDACAHAGIYNVSSPGVCFVHFA
jgi:hypothetical protein